MNRLNEYLVVIIRIILGTIFLWASFDKIIDPAQFARSISNYHIVPLGLENSVAIILPWIEFFIGSGLILGIMVDGATIITSFLLIIFNIMITQAIMRGFDIDCGCGLKDGQLVGIEKILENFVLLGGSYILFIRANRLLEIYPKTKLSDK